MITVSLLTQAQRRRTTFTGVHPSSCITHQNYTQNHANYRET